MMTVNNSIYLIVLFIHEVCKINCSVAHVNQFITTKEEDKVSLTCLFSDVELHRALWYKQDFGEKPVIIVSSYHRSQPNEFNSNFGETRRFQAVRNDNSFNLTILRTSKSDSGTYLCASAFSSVITFTTRTVLLVTGADPKPTVIQHPALGVIKPGSNVTLQCSVQAKMCDNGVQQVYWFRHGLYAVQHGMVYTHGDMDNGCGKTSAASSNTQSCFYNLSKMNVGRSDTGMYYCAVVTCDEILFGNGTSLTIEDEFNIESMQYFTLIGLAVLCTVSFIINIFFCILLRKKGRTLQAEHIHANNDVTVQYRHTDDINYAALNFSTKRCQRKRTLENTVYS